MKDKEAEVFGTASPKPVQRQLNQGTGTRIGSDQTKNQELWPKHKKTHK